MVRELDKGIFRNVTDRNRMVLEKLDGDYNGCPKCSKELLGDEIPAVIKRCYPDLDQEEIFTKAFKLGWTATNKMREDLTISIYCTKTDRTISYQCPFCDFTWNTSKGK